MFPLVWCQHPPGAYTWPWDCQIALVSLLWLPTMTLKSFLCLLAFAVFIWIILHSFHHTQTCYTTGYVCYIKSLLLSYLHKIAALAGMAQLVECCPTQPKEGCQFTFQSGHMPGLQAWSPVRVHVRGNRSMFLSHNDVSLPLFLSTLLSLK